MSTRRWLRAAGLVATAAVAVAVLSRFRRPTELGELRVTPPAARLSVRVGEAVRFSAEAAGATGVTWSVWGRPRSFDPAWVYVPGPEETGWQHVSVEITGAAGARRAYTWDVGVVPAIAPELVALTPPEGRVEAQASEPARFRAEARVPAARPGDRLQFEWTVDGSSVQRDGSAAEGASSELVLADLKPGTHRVVVHVSEDERVASVAEWTLEVPAADWGAELAQQKAVPQGQAPPPAPSPAPPPEPPPAAPPPSVEAAAPELALREPVTPEPPPPPSTVPDRTGAAPSETPPAEARAPATEVAALEKRAEPPPPPAPRLVRAPGPRTVVRAPGDRLALAVGVKPAEADVSYEWSVDGRRHPGRGPTLEYRADKPGRHRVVVDVRAADRRVGTDAWDIDVRAPKEEAPRPVVGVTTTSVPAVAVARATPPTTAAAPGRLVEADVRQWLQEYERAWSRKDADALRRMGQIRSAGEVEQMERYFRSVQALDVNVRVISLVVEGDRATVEFERVDTVTDPSGRRQALRLPPLRKQIERTPGGLRFAGQR